MKDSDQERHAPESGNTLCEGYERKNKQNWIDVINMHVYVVDYMSLQIKISYVPPLRTTNMLYV